MQGMSVLLEELARDGDESLDALVVVTGERAADVELDVWIERDPLPLRSIRLGLADESRFAIAGSACRLQAWMPATEQASMPATDIPRTGETGSRSHPAGRMSGANRPSTSRM